MENKKEMRSWLDEMNLTHPFVIAGPCSAETEDQVMRIANELKDTDVTAVSYTHLTLPTKRIV